MLIRLASDETLKYFETAPPPVGPVVSLVFDVIVLAGVILLLLTIRDRVPVLKRVVEVILALLGVMATYQCEHLLLLWLRSLRSQSEFNPPPHTGWEIAVICGLLLTALLSRRFLAIAKRMVFILSPLFLVFIANAAWSYSRPDLAHLGSYVVAGKLSGNSGKTSTVSRPRVIWIIFDEMDYHLAFEGRPSRLQMPEFDRLRRESLFGERVSAPARYTLLSMPSFITGRKVVDVKVKMSDLDLRFENSHDWVSFAAAPNLFRNARKAGFNTAIAGWLHPYCRVLGDDLSECSSASSPPDEAVIDKKISIWPMWKRAIFTVLWDASYLPLHTAKDLVTPQPGIIQNASRAPSNASTAVELLLRTRQILQTMGRLRREEQIRSVNLITTEAVRMLRDPDLNLVMIHFPAPHPEGIWDSEGRRFSAIGPSDYIDNLALADYLLSAVRRALEATGNWDSTSILISADHPFRVDEWNAAPSWNPEMESLTRGKSLKYVPFLLKLPGHQPPAAISRPFNNVVSSALILRILRGQILEPKQVIKFLASVD